MEHGNLGQKYDRIGHDYNLTRKADPYLVKRLAFNLGTSPEGIYLDIGCGTGNYTLALQALGYDLVGVEPSQTMLDKAIKRKSPVEWKQGSAEKTRLIDQSISGTMAMLTIHHWENLDLAFKEMYRVLKKGSRLVIFTSDPEQMKGYWLNAYFPEIMKASIKQMPDSKEVITQLEKVGFIVSNTEKYFVKPDLEDLFLYAGKHRPELYFEADVRSGISSFADLANHEQVQSGLERMRTDMGSGKITDLMSNYENTLGDYLFIIATKA